MDVRNARNVPNFVTKRGKHTELPKRINKVNHYLPPIRSMSDSLVDRVESLDKERRNLQDEAEGYMVQLQRLTRENEIMREQISSLLQYQEGQAQLIRNTDLDFSCPVCMLDYSEKLQPNIWTCGHIVCSTCTNKISSCPQCRKAKAHIVQKCPDYLKAIEVIRKITSK